VQDGTVFCIIYYFDLHHRIISTVGTNVTISEASFPKPNGRRGNKLTINGS
jgi:hypothetical protein